MKSLGLIETLGMVSAIVSADTALKTANVELESIQKVSGGLVSVILSGDVGAIKAAVESVEGIKSDFNIVSLHTIARPATDVSSLYKEVKEVEKEVKEVEKEVKEDKNVEEVKNVNKSKSKK